MKSFLAGLGLGLVAAVVLGRRTQGGNRQKPSFSSTAVEPREGSHRRILVAASRPERGPKSGSQQAALAPEGKGARPAPPPQPAPVLSPEEVLNSATRQQLLSVYGIGPVLADRIIQNRPYAAVHDVVKQGIIPESIFLQLRKQLLDQRQPGVRDGEASYSGPV